MLNSPLPDTFYSRNKIYIFDTNNCQNYQTIEKSALDLINQQSFTKSYLLLASSWLHSLISSFDACKNYKRLTNNFIVIRQAVKLQCMQIQEYMMSVSHRMSVGMSICTPTLLTKHLQETLSSHIIEVNIYIFFYWCYRYHDFSTGLPPKPGACSFCYTADPLLLDKRIRQPEVALGCLGITVGVVVNLELHVVVEIKTSC